MRKITKIIFMLFMVFAIVACTDETETPIVDDVSPVITGATDDSTFVGVSFDLLEGIIATDDVDGVITSSINIILPEGLTEVDGIIIFDHPGSYQIQYQVSDAAGNSTTVARTITVLDDNELDEVAPVILGVEAKTIYIFEKINLRLGVTAFDDVDGTITNRIQITLPEGIEFDQDQMVSFDTHGSYAVTYTVSDEAGNTTSVEQTITVLDLDLNAPDIQFGDNTAYVGQWFNIMEGVTAIDDIDGDVTHQVTYVLGESLLIADGLVKLPSVGNFEITYYVKDSSMNEAEVTRVVTVNEMESTTTSMIENGDFMLYRHVLYLDGGQATAQRTDQTITINVANVIENEDSVYLERRMISYTGGLVTTSFGITATGTGSLEDLGEVDVIAGYYDIDGNFIEILTQPLSASLTNFTPPVTTSQGAIRLVFRNTGSLTISRFWLQTQGGSGSNPNLVRDNDNGRGFLLPYGWVTESTVSGFSLRTVYVDDVRSIEVDVATASNARLQYENITLQNGKTYVFEFDIKASQTQLINAIIGYHGQSTTVSSSGSYAGRLLTEVEVDEAWQTVSIEYLAVDASALYKLQLNLTKANTVFHIANFIVFEKPIESGEEAIYAFREKVYSIGEVTVDSGALIDAALDYYAAMTEEDQSEVAAEYELLMSMHYTYNGLLSLSSTPVTLLVNQTFNLFDGLTYNDYFGTDVVVTYELPEDLASDDQDRISMSEAMQFTVIYKIYDQETLIATHSRVITVSLPEPKVLDVVMPNGDFSIMKYHVYGGTNTFDLNYTRDDVILQIESLTDDMVYVERTGISFRRNVTTTSFTITHTTNIDYTNIRVVMGYYDVDGNFITEYENQLTPDGVMPSFTSNVTTSHGIMRIELLEAGDFTLHGVRMQSGTSGVQNIIRDYARAAVNLPAYFNSGSADLSSFHVTVDDGIFTVVNESSSSTRTLVYENMAMEMDTTYEISIWLRGTEGKPLTWAVGSDSQDTSTGRLSSMRNRGDVVFTVTEEWELYTFEYTTNSENTNLNLMKIYMTFANSSTIEMRDMVAVVVNGEPAGGN